MTGYDVYVRALSLLGETVGRDKAFSELALPLLNQIIIQSESINRSIEASKGLDTSKSHQIDYLKAEILMDEELVSECFPYGLAALLCVNEDREHFNWLNYEFNSRLFKKCPAVITEIKGDGIDE
jgi:hypothetical protein